MIAVIAHRDGNHCSAPDRCVTIHPMNQPQTEPGLLQAFRLYTGLRLGLVLFTLCAAIVRPRGLIEWGTVFALIELSVTLVYLLSSWLQAKLGKWYLPIALTAATIGPILEVALGLRRSQLALLTGGGVTSDIWQATILLLLPLLFVACQYSFFAVVIFTAGTALLEFVFVVAGELLLGQQYPILHVLAIILRSVIFLIEGGVLTRIMIGQRQQRLALHAANGKLARYASTIEQLATSRERNRLARELHDTLAHTLSVLAVQLEGASALLATNPETAQRMIVQSAALTRNGLTEARRAIHTLRAMPLDDLGLVLALQGLAEATAERTEASLSLELDPNVSVANPDTEQALYRIAEEALTNIARHAAATRITVRLSRTDTGELSLVLADNGCGFEASTAPAGHYGLRGIQERVEMLGGTLSIVSRPGTGTTIEVKVKG
jgi:signal transduction histidine kinase